MNYHKCLYSLVIISIVVSVVNCHHGYDHDVAKHFSDHQVVPNVIPFPPKQGLKVKYNDVDVKFGNELTPTEVKDIPTVEWDADSSEFYTLMMVDPDAPSRQDNKFAEWHHWVVVNIPGNDLSKGDTILEYIGAGPPPDTGLHRYVFLVFKQQHQHDFDEPKSTNKSGKGRELRSVKKFAEKHALGDAVAGNFFQAKYDDYVPILYKQLGE